MGLSCKISLNPIHWIEHDRNVAATLWTYSGLSTAQLLPNHPSWGIFEYVDSWFPQYHHGQGGSRSLNGEGSRPRHKDLQDRHQLRPIGRIISVHRNWMDTNQPVSAWEWSIAQEMTNLAILLFIIVLSGNGIELWIITIYRNGTDLN